MKIIPNMVFSPRDAGEAIVVSVRIGDRPAVAIADGIVDAADRRSAALRLAEVFDAVAAELRAHDARMEAL